MDWDKDYINKIICGDCLDVMDDIPDDVIDLAIADPPYVLGDYYNNPDTSKHHRDKWLLWCRTWLSECIRVANGVIVIPGTPNLYDWLKIPIKPVWIGSCYISYQDDIPELYSASPIDGRCYWDAVVFYGNIKANVDSWVFRFIKKEESKHPCPKPLSFWKCLIECCPKGGIVLDPFIGSGTTAIAAKEMDRKFIGIDIDSNYCDIARSRL